MGKKRRRMFNPKFKTHHRSKFKLQEETLEKLKVQSEISTNTPETESIEKKEVVLKTLKKEATDKKVTKKTATKNRRTKKATKRTPHKKASSKKSDK